MNILQLCDGLSKKKSTFGAAINHYIMADKDYNSIKIVLVEKKTAGRRFRALHSLHHFMESMARW